MTDDTPAVNNAPKRVSKRLRFEVFRRDGFRCRYCGLLAAETGEGLTIDHVVPVALGGTNLPTNLVTACRDCNSGKSSASPEATHVDEVAEDALRWADAMRLAAEQRRKEMGEFDGGVDEFAEEWNALDMGSAPRSWEDTVRHFLSAGLDPSDLRRAVRITHRKNLPTYDRFRYFCGICWRSINEIQELARVILAEKPAPRPFEPEDTDEESLYAELGSDPMGVSFTGIYY